jgi:hypothetical protein
VRHRHPRRTGSFSCLMLAMQLCWHRKESLSYSTRCPVQCQHNVQLPRVILGSQ